MLAVTPACLATNCKRSDQTLLIQGPFACTCAKFAAPATPHMHMLPLMRFLAAVMSWPPVLTMATGNCRLSNEAAPSRASTAGCCSAWQQAGVADCVDEPSACSSADRRSQQHCETWHVKGQTKCNISKMAAVSSAMAAERWYSSRTSSNSTTDCTCKHADMHSSNCCYSKSSPGTYLQLSQLKPQWWSH